MTPIAPPAPPVRAGFIQPVGIDLKRARAMWKAGVSSADIARELGCSRQNISHHAATRGWGLRRQGRSCGRSPIDWRVVALLLRDGHPVDAVAKQVGCAPESIRKRRRTPGGLPDVTTETAPARVVREARETVRGIRIGCEQAKMVDGPVVVRCAWCVARYPLPDADAARVCPHCHRAERSERAA